MRIFFFLFAFACLLHAEDGDTVTSYRHSASANGTRFSVTVNGVPLPTLDMSLPGSGCTLARFAFTGQAQIQVTVNDGWAASAILSPKKYALPTTVSGNTVSFTLDRPRKLVLRGPTTVPLLLLVAEAPEADVPLLGESGVTDVASFGADATGSAETTTSLQRAIDACPTGGTVYVGPGIYIIGQLNLKSDMAFYLAPGSLLRAKKDINPSYGSGILTARNASHIRIFGHGAIDGQGMYWRYNGGWYSLISIGDCTDIRIEDVFCLEPCTSFIDATHSNNVVLRNLVLVANTDYENTDGFSFDGRSFLVEDSLIWNTDASLAATGMNAVACQDFIARNCVLRGPIINYPSLELADPLLTMSEFTYENLDWPMCNMMVTMWPIAGAHLNNHWYKNLRVESWFDWTSNLGQETYKATGMQCRIMVGSWEPKSRDDKLGFIRNQFFCGLRFDTLPGENSQIGGWDANLDVQMDFQDFFVAGARCTSNTAAGIDLIGTYKAGSTGSYANVSYGPTVTPEVGIDVASSYARRGGAPVAFTVRRTGSTTQALTVSLYIGGNAKAGVDYQTFPSTVSFAPGSNEASVVIQALGSGAARGLVVGLNNQANGATWTLGAKFHAMITITPAQSAAPIFSTHPSSITVTAPAMATFTMAVSGSPAPACQWQSSPLGSSTFTAINGATSSSYTTSATTPAMSGTQYRCVATNSAGSATSSIVVLTVTTGSALPSGW